eukprot:385929_1
MDTKYSLMIDVQQINTDKQPQEPDTNTRNQTKQNEQYIRPPNKNQYYLMKPIRHPLNNGNDKTFMMTLATKEAATGCLTFCCIVPLILVLIGFILYLSNPNGYWGLYLLIFGGTLLFVAIIWLIRSRNIGYEWVIFNEHDNTVKHLKEYWYSDKFVLTKMGTFSTFNSTSTYRLTVNTRVNGIKTNSTTTGHLYFVFEKKNTKTVFVGRDPSFSNMLNYFHKWFSSNYPNHPLTRK